MARAVEPFSGIAEQREDKTLLTSILQPSHVILILVVVLLVLGPKRLPDAGRALGQGLREFKASIGGHESNESS
jgi:sec-independent protein translocase protein TatA